MVVQACEGESNFLGLDMHSGGLLRWWCRAQKTGVPITAEAQRETEKCCKRPRACADWSTPCCRADGNGQRHLNALFAGPGNKPMSEGAAPSAQGSYCNLAMNGQEVFKFAVRAVPTVIEGALANAGMEKEAIDWLVLHQANMRILSSAADRLGVPQERVVSNLERYGNTSAASIPLALDEAVRAGDIKPGQVVAMAGFGAGLSWASAIVRWG